MEGIISPIITPLSSDRSLDLESLEMIIERMIVAGIAGVFINGTTGEFSSFTTDFKCDLVKETSKIVKGRIPVLAGISSTSPQESYALGRLAKVHGAEAIVASPPFYLKLNQEEVFEYYKRLLSEIGLPMYLYNIPSLVKVQIDVETVFRLSEIPGIIGLKDSSADLDYFRKIAQQFKEDNFEVFMGPEELLREALQAGANGGVNGGSNIFPEWYIELFKAFNEQDFEKVDLIQKRILKFSQKIYAFTDDPNSYLKGLKAAMSVKGLCQNQMASPLKAYSEQQLEQIAHILKRF